MKEVKRGKGKIKECLAIRDMYKVYKETYHKEGDKVIDYKTYSKIVKKCNKELVNLIVYKAEEIQLPYRLGSLQIAKFKRSLNQPLNKLAMDFKKSKELGFRVFHDSPFIYKWRWKKHNMVVRRKTGYSFKTNRFAAREVPKALKLKVDYFC